MHNQRWSLASLLDTERGRGAAREATKNTAAEGLGSGGIHRRNDPRYARYRMKRPVSSTQLMKFEARLVRARLAPGEHELLALAKSIVQSDGTIDLHALAARSGNPLRVIRRKRARLEARGLWPWVTDKSRVGPPRRSTFTRETRDVERTKREIREAWLRLVAARSAPLAPESASPALEAPSLRDICRTYLDEFHRLRYGGERADAPQPTMGRTAAATHIACREKSTLTSNLL